MRIALAAVAVSSVAFAQPGSTCPVAAGSRMATVKGVDVSNHSFSTASIKGWSFITIGASWCEPCRKELPAWDGLAGKYASKATFIAVDVEDSASAGQKFHATLKLANLKGLYTTAVGNLGDVMPTTYVVDDKGVVRYVHCGFNVRNVSGEVAAMDAELKKIP